MPRAQPWVLGIDKKTPLLAGFFTLVKSVKPRVPFVFVADVYQQGNRQ